MDTTITKVSDTQYQETTPQPDLVVVKSLSDLLTQKSNIEQGITNNQAQIDYLNGELQKLNDKITQVQNLGIVSTVSDEELPDNG